MRELKADLIDHFEQRGFANAIGTDETDTGILRRCTDKDHKMQDNTEPKEMVK